MEPNNEKIELVKRSLSFLATRGLSAESAWDVTRSIGEAIDNLVDGIFVELRNRAVAPASEGPSFKKDEPSVAMPVPASPWLLIDKTRSDLSDGDPYFEIKGVKSYYDRQTGEGFTMTGFISPSDARTMAAAPLLLAACKDALEAFLCIDDCECVDDGLPDGESAMCEPCKLKRKLRNAIDQATK
jgi:hypothetical protein